MLINIGVFSMLGLCSIEDLKQKKVNAVQIILFAFAGVLINLMINQTRVSSLVFGLAAGIILYMIAIFTDEKIGKGDALVIGALGVYLGLVRTVQLLWMASAMAAIYGMAIMLIKKENKKYEMPFVPFLLVGYLITILISICGGVSCI